MLELPHHRQNVIVVAVSQGRDAEYLNLISAVLGPWSFYTPWAITGCLGVWRLRFYTAAINHIADVADRKCPAEVGLYILIANVVTLLYGR